MLFLASTITAVVLTASGTVFLLFDSILKNALAQSPQAIGWIEEDATVYSILHPERVEQLIQQHGTEVEYQFNMTLLPVIENEYEYAVMAERDFNQLASQQGHETITLSEHELFAISPFFSKWAERRH